MAHEDGKDRGGGRRGSGWGGSSGGRDATRRWRRRRPPQDHPAKGTKAAGGSSRQHRWSRSNWGQGSYYLIFLLLLLIIILLRGPIRCSHGERPAVSIERQSEATIGDPTKICFNCFVVLAWLRTPAVECPKELLLLLFAFSSSLRLQDVLPTWAHPVVHLHTPFTPSDLVEIGTRRRHR